MTDRQKEENQKKVQRNPSTLTELTDRNQRIRSGTKAGPNTPGDHSERNRCESLQENVAKELCTCQEQVESVSVMIDKMALIDNEFNHITWEDSQFKKLAHDLQNKSLLQEDLLFQRSSI